MNGYLKGVRAEDLAKLYLEKKGWIWIQSRIKTPYGEIDLLMQDKDIFVVIEVKFRKAFVLESLSLRQQKRIEQAYLWWLSCQDNPDRVVRFDAVFITPTPYPPYLIIKHIKQAWTSYETLRW